MDTKQPEDGQKSTHVFSILNRKKIFNKESIRNKTKIENLRIKLKII